MMQSAKRRKMERAIRRRVLETSPNVVFEDGTDTLLKLGCLLFLEKVASEAREVARLEGSKTKVGGDEVKKAVTSVMADVRQF
jgi:hypothetical protein